MIKVEPLPSLGPSQQLALSIQNPPSCGAGYALQNGSHTAFWSSIAANSNPLALYHQQQQQQHHHQRQYDHSSLLSDDDESIASLTNASSSQSSNCSTPPGQSVVMNVDESLPHVDPDNDYDDLHPDNPSADSDPTRISIKNLITIDSNPNLSIPFQSIKKQKLVNETDQIFSHAIYAPRVSLQPVCGLPPAILQEEPTGFLVDGPTVEDALALDTQDSFVLYTQKYKETLRRRGYYNSDMKQVVSLSCARWATETQAFKKKFEDCVAKAMFLKQNRVEEKSSLDTKPCLDEESNNDARHSSYLSSGTMSWELSSGSENSMNEYAKRAQPICFDSMFDNEKNDGNKSFNLPAYRRPLIKLERASAHRTLLSPVSDCSPETRQTPITLIQKKYPQVINPAPLAGPRPLPVYQQRKRRLSADLNDNINALTLQEKQGVDQAGSRIFANARGFTRASPSILPCKTKDTEQAKFSVLNIIPSLISEKHRKAAFVENLVDTSALILEVIWCDFHINPAAKIIPLRVFLQETLRRSKTSYSTLQTALFYLIRIKAQIGSRACRTPGKSEYPLTPTSEVPQRRENNDPATCGRRMFLAALIVASKYLQDRNYSNKAWSKISGLAVEEINQNEIVFLKLIDYNLFIAEDIFKKWSSLLLTHIQAISGSSIDNAGGFRQVENQREVDRFRETLRKMDPATIECNPGDRDYTGNYLLTPDTSAPASPREEHDQSDRGLSLSVSSSPQQMDIDQTSKI